MKRSSPTDATSRAIEIPLARIFEQAIRRYVEAQAAGGDGGKDARMRDAHDADESIALAEERRPEM